MGSLGAELGVVPGEAGYFVLDRERHQVVIGGVEFDLIDAHAMAVKGAQFRAVPVGGVRLLESLGGTGDFAERRQPVLGPAGPFPRDAFAQGRIIVPKILVAQVWRHVGDVVSGQTGEGLSGDHRIQSLLIRRRAVVQPPPRTISENACVPLVGSLVFSPSPLTAGRGSPPKTHSDRRNQSH